MAKTKKLCHQVLVAVLLLTTLRTTLSAGVAFPMSLSASVDEHNYTIQGFRDHANKRGPPCRAKIFSDYLDYPGHKGKEDMVPEVAQICGKYGYRKTMMPNLVFHQNQKEALAAFHQYELLLQTNCSTNLELLLCFYLFPLPNGDEQFPHAPQRSLCRDVESQCSHIFVLTARSWPQQLNCSWLPERVKVCGSQFQLFPCIGEPLSAESLGGAADERGPGEPSSPEPTATATVGVSSTPPPTTEVPTMPTYRSWERRAGAAGPFVGSQCTLFASGGRRDRAPQQSRDIITQLGYPHTAACCAECSAVVKRTVKLMNTNKTTSQWSWGFVGSVMQADVIVESGQRIFTLDVRVDHVEEGGPLRNRIAVRIAAKGENECVCARPDAISSNLFLGNTQRFRQQIHRMDIIWPSPRNGQRLPKPFRKWKKLRHAAAKLSERGLLSGSQ